MCKNDDSFLIEDSFPYFVELVYPEQINDNFQIAADIQLSHFHSRPSLVNIFIQFLKRSLYKFIVIKIREKHFDSTWQS